MYILAEVFEFPWILLGCILAVSGLLTYFGPNDPRLGLPPRKRCAKCGHEESSGNCDAGPR